MSKKVNLIVLLILVFYSFFGNAQTWEIKDTIIDSEQFYIYPTKKKECCWESVDTWMVNGKYRTKLPKDGNWIQLFEKNETRIAKKYQIKNGVLNGYWLEFYLNEQTELSGEYCNEIKCGKWTQYYNNGQTKDITSYAKGEPLGESISYFENGNKERKGAYDGYDKNGLWQYFHKNGQLKFKQNYINGTVTDDSIVSYDSIGQVHFKGGLKNGIPNREWITYYPNRNIESLGSFTIKEVNVCSGGIANIAYKDLKIGKWKYFYNSGKLFAEVEYRLVYKRSKKQSRVLDKQTIYSKIYFEKYYSERGERIKKKKIKEKYPILNEKVKTVYNNGYN
ncbi:hypothetical protein QSV08_12365 [Maribacter sp. BPC-D8]|uniref:toxin-antitoxin system YwqK family antitoxin n=1 Tax=Maribacter sp. BPC-D8 TaxID=3053613 RepID=UPI002B4891EF|nr:hypothetical protein [Maribacter sp. BPC-D8]WRI28018.1 hypothetical protein QSV08_12365 [Maribacter sp. BPC-D8]